MDPHRLDRSEPGVGAPLDGPAEPVRAAARVDAIDVLRGVAVLGILPMNVMTFAWPISYYFNPTSIGAVPYEGLDRVAYWVVHTLFDLKMMAIFSMLFGAGALLFDRKRERVGPSHARALWLRRCVWLLVIGMVHAYLVWEGDILVAYAVLGLVLVWWVRRLPAWALVAIASVMLLVHFGLMEFEATWVHANEHPAKLREWMGMDDAAIEAARTEFEASFGRNFRPTEQQVGEDVAALRSGYAELVRHRAPFVLVMQTFVFGMFVFWRVGAMMLIGMALMKWRVLTCERSPRFYAILAGLCYAIGLPMVLGGILYNESHGFSMSQTYVLGRMGNTVGGVPVAIGHVALVMLLVRAGVLRPVLARLGAAGRMALTNYLSQSVLCAIAFYGFGFGLAGRLDRVEQLALVAVIWAMQLLWSPWWLRRYRFGPGEWLWRSLTYWRAQPMASPSSAGATR